MKDSRKETYVGELLFSRTAWRCRELGSDCEIETMITDWTKRAQTVVLHSVT